MMPLTLNEYQSCNVNLPLDLGQREILNKSHIEVTPSTEAGFNWTLRPSSYIGTVRLGDRSIIVRPKIPIDRVMFLIAYAIDPKEWKNYFDLSPAPDVLESIIPAFVHHTRRAVQRGLLQGYRHEEERRRFIPSWAASGLPNSLTGGSPSRYPLKSLTTNLPRTLRKNRLLKTALHRLARLPVRSDTSRKDVNALRPVFNSIELGAYRRGDAINRIHPP